MIRGTANRLVQAYPFEGSLFHSGRRVNSVPYLLSSSRDEDQPAATVALTCTYLLYLPTKRMLPTAVGRGATFETLSHPSMFGAC
jgi:hypothetical protein